MSFDGSRAATLPTVQQQTDYWKYWQRTRSRSQYARERADEVLGELCKLALDQPRILDLGCGTGWFTEELATLGRATGLDLNEEAMAHARSRRRDIRFVAGNLLEPSFEPHSFDVVVSMQVLAHVTNQSEFVNTIARLLRPGGYLLLTTTNRLVVERLSKDKVDHRQLGHIEKWLSRRETRRLVSPRFQILETRTVSPIGHEGFLRVTNSQKLNDLLALVVSRDRIRRFKERLGLGYTILLVGRKRD